MTLISSLFFTLDYSFNFEKLFLLCAVDSNPSIFYYSDDTTDLETSWACRLTYKMRLVCFYCIFYLLLKVNTN